MSQEGEEGACVDIKLCRCLEKKTDADFKKKSKQIKREN